MLSKVWPGMPDSKHGQTEKEAQGRCGPVDAQRNAGCDCQSGEADSEASQGEENAVALTPLSPDSRNENAALRCTVSDHEQVELTSPHGGFRRWLLMLLECEECFHLEARTDHEKKLLKSALSLWKSTGFPHPGEWRDKNHPQVHIDVFEWASSLIVHHVP